MTEPAFELDPPAHLWASLLDFDPHRHAEERAKLGLPTDRPIVMAGHQGEFWHAGIAAKLFAAQSLADRVGGAAAWLVVDTADTEPLTLRAPRCDEDGRLAEHTLRVDRTTAERSPLSAILEVYERHRGAGSPELRTTLTTLDMLPGPMPALISSSSLSETEAFSSLVRAFEADPASERERYNAAVRSHPNAGIPELIGDAVPFWRVTPSGGRMPARAADLSGPLWPRALAMTGVARASLCDLFIHGTGGRAYEPINDAWIGQPLAPFVTTTATLRLRFEGDTVSASDAAHAAWLAHHAAHQPRLLGDERAQQERDRIAAELAALPRHAPRRATLFAELHRVLAGARREHAGTLASLAEEADQLRIRAAERELREDRTWPAVLHDPADLAQLRDVIDAAFG